VELRFKKIEDDKKQKCSLIFFVFVIWIFLSEFRFGSPPFFARLPLLSLFLSLLFSFLSSFSNPAKPQFKMQNPTCGVLFSNKFINHLPLPLLCLPGFFNFFLPPLDGCRACCGSGSQRDIGMAPWLAVGIVKVGVLAVGAL
jgi:hypothetical protein